MKKYNKIGSLLLIIAVAVLSVNFPPLPAQAASLSSLSDTLSSAKTSNSSNHDICFVTPGGVPASGVITLSFLTNFNIPILDFTDVDVITGASCAAAATQQTLAASPSGATWGVATSSLVMTLTNGSTVFASSTAVRIRIGTNATNQSTGVHQITNPTTTGTKTVTIAGSAGFVDTGTASVQIITDDTVAVSGTVNQALTFSISANTIAFGTLDSGNPRYANTSTGSASDVVAHTLAVSTNGNSGYTITVRGQTLTSAQNSANTITANGASPVTSSTGNEQFGIYATKAGGVNGTIATPYATGSSFGYDATATTTTTFSSGTSATALETYSLHYIANISGTTEAGTYNASLVYVGTANF